MPHTNRHIYHILSVEIPLKMVINERAGYKAEKELFF